MKYIDTHGHLFLEYYTEEEMQNIINTSKEKSIEKIIGVATDLNNSKELLELSISTNQYVLPTIGIHPSEARINFEAELEKFNIDEFIAVGEVGIDLYHEDNPPLEVQKNVFKKFIQLAIKHNKPLIIHMRDAEEEVYQILREFKGNIKFVMHSFTSTLEWANKFIELGGYISFSGIVTFKNAKDLQSIAKSIPLDKIVVETDAPYLTPTPHRGQKNFPYYVEHIAKYIAELRDEDFSVVINTLLNNSKELFNIE